MSAGEVGSKKNATGIVDPITSVSAEMDYTLLASDMHKVLNIPKSNMLEGEPGGSSCNNNLSDAKKSKSRNGTCLEDVHSNKCPLCPLSFNAKELLARHALRVHQKAVVSLLQDVSTEQHLKCRFCVHKVMHRHQKLLLLHLEKKHAVEFVAFLKQSWIPSSISHLQEGMKSLSLFGSDVNSKANESPSTAMNEPENDAVFHIPSNKPINFLGNQLSNIEISVVINSRIPCAQPSNYSFAKRKLILDGSCNSQPSRAFLMKENVPPEEPLHATLAGSAWKHAEGKHFACGRCKEAFSCNALLLDHVSVRHRGPLRLLQPLYTCGLCSASFYKNSFLVRHCYQHHTPK
ncbi:uncharacterized protein LOC117640536 [Thrips palmi]|uniref:Uncharacterized protein LOC117640536 n=1 Tax=Thrips palmi TaxID=161013 RepID=A0A6P8ZI44_THRPL|nr:uncharacterized protein LOC117640536 [Thrips palmi]